MSVKCSVVWCVPYLLNRIPRVCSTAPQVAFVIQLTGHSFEFIQKFVSYQNFRAQNIFTDGMTVASEAEEHVKPTLFRFVSCLLGRMTLLIAH